MTCHMRIKIKRKATLASGCKPGMWQSNVPAPKIPGYSDPWPTKAYSEKLPWP